MSSGPVAPLLSIIPMLCACAAPDSEPSASSEPGALAAYERVSRGTLDAYYAAHPVRSTSLGLHDWDEELPDWSAEGVARRLEELGGWLERLEAVDARALPEPHRTDHEILRRAILAERLGLERIARWRHDPRLYNSLAARSIASLAERRFAPLDQRMASMTARLVGLPALLATARANLADVPPLWVELALRDSAGTIDFLERDLVAMLRDQGLDGEQGAGREAWEQARAAAIEAVRSYRAWMAEDLAPRADGDFRLGAELFLEKLRLEEFVELTADELWRRNEAAIARYQDWVARVAAEIDPERTPAEVMASVTLDFPSPGELIPTARRMLKEAREFIVANEIVTLPSDRMPTVRPTPEYARMGFASMSTPGPFERVATEAYYNITNVDEEWTEEEKTQHLTYFNRPGLLGITVHEAMPGHFVQLLYEQRIPTEVRRVFTPATLVEGWAHYTEQMMVDEGFGGGDPRIRLGQLRRALQRHARWYAGMALHVKGVSIEEAAERFAEIAYFAPFPALREVQRGTYDATYLYYALGRMQIFELREALRERAAADGREFSLQEFHDRFLELGLAVPLAGEAMTRALSGE